MSGEGLNIVIVDDHVALRRGLELLLRQRGFSVVGTAETVERGYELIRKSRPHVAVIDINLGEGNGVDLCRRVLAEEPEFPVLLYTGVDDDEMLAGALDSGARGFALKAGAPEELIDAIQSVARGGTYVDPRLRQTLLARRTTDRIGALSPREREILDLLADGLTGEAIAERLVLSPETVRTHVRNAMDKLEANTRVHAIAIALRQGEITL